MHSVLETYIPLVEFLGRSLGESYEVFLVDLQDPAHPIVAIENGQNSGRNVGSLMRDETVKYFEEKSKDDPDFILRQQAVGVNGTRYVSSTKIIRDEEGELVGALLINFNMEPIIHMMDLLEAFGSESKNLQQVDVNSVMFAGEVLPDRVVSLQSLYKHVMNQVNKDETDKTKLRQKIINALYLEGAFDLKGAVPYYAGQMKISEPSVYRYLQKAKEQYGKKPPKR